MYNSFVGSSSDFFVRMRESISGGPFEFKFQVSVEL